MPLSLECVATWVLATGCSTYESLKGRLERRGMPSAVTHLVPACAGAVLSAAVRVPGDTLKHRVQAYLYPNIFVVGWQAEAECRPGTLAAAATSLQ